eukprot:TRINITY_DN16273_c0_g1_i1.p1 TRINITY_DN16273_c0_g1~~TRINITY_DN16273_c0_g1_i1.p1  ORF type:complete len:108 (-),score=6.63 TRINITY_DN16273_c0_g1_i1:62-385(-)
MADTSQLVFDLPKDASHSIASFTTSEGVRVRAYVEKVSWTTQVLYHNPTGRSFILYFSTRKKDGSSSKGSFLANICKLDEVKKNSVSASNLVSLKQVDKSTWDTLNY